MPDIEVTLPISPSQCLYVSHNRAFAGFIDAPLRAVTELNRRHIAHCDEHFISCREQINPGWFESPPMPEDAWENQRADEVTGGAD